jgi:hypothetical protein
MEPFATESPEDVTGAAIWEGKAVLEGGAFNPADDVTPRPARLTDIFPVRI